MSGSHACIDNQLSRFLVYLSVSEQIDPAASEQGLWRLPAAPISYLRTHRSICSPDHGHLAASPLIDGLRKANVLINQAPSKDQGYCSLACRQTISTRPSLTSLSENPAMPASQRRIGLPELIEKEQSLSAEKPSRQLY
jgi:hypothetical protein